jgi:hypothetical protein
MIQAVRQYWKNLEITRKLVVAFGSIEILIMITIAICTWFLYYIQHELKTWCLR